MPWKEVSRMDQRTQFILQATATDANLRAICRAFQISPTTAYKLLHRFRDSGHTGLIDRSRTPHRSPRRTPAVVDAAVVALRQAHPAWGGRKLHAVLVAQGLPAPHPSTITDILRRNDLIDPTQSAKHRPFQRFEHAAPNELWQMDFKGHFALAAGGRCHPLTVLDDHSRYLLGLVPCGDERRETVQRALTSIFAEYGLPERMVMDNGLPWGGGPEIPYTRLTAWLIRLGIGVSHGRPYHPQTQGKDERLHRTFREEVLEGHVLVDLPHCAVVFPPWRVEYNEVRPHEAVGLHPPASRYRKSERSFPAVLPPVEYDAGDVVRKVQGKGEISFHGRVYVVGHAFAGEPVAVRETAEDGLLAVYYCQQRIATLDRRTPPA